MAHIDDPHTHRANLDYIRDSMSDELLEKDVELALARAWRDNGDEAAMQRIISAYRRLVIAAAAKFRHYGLPYGDLIQEGNIGLLEAVNRFDPDRELRFSTYATWWVRSCMQDYVLRNWSIVRTGTTSAQKSLFFNLRRLKSQIASVDGMQHLDDEGRAKIAKDLGVTVREVENMDMRLSGGDQSLNLMIGEDGDSELQSLLPSDAPSPEAVVLGMKDSESRSKWLNDALSDLSEREQRIIRERHLTYEPVTLDQLGQALGISKERVRQLEARAFTKLREVMAHKVGTHDELFLES